MKYSIDTSALLEAWTRHYPHDIFTGLWQRFDTLIETGELRAIDEVQFELSKKDDDIHDWIKNRPNLIAPIVDPVQAVVSEILRDHPYIVKQLRNRTSADVFVIALAEVENAKVIAYEKASNNPDKPKIPDICRVRNVECITLLDMFREQRWTFA